MLNWFHGIIMKFHVGLYYKLLRILIFLLFCKSMDKFFLFYVMHELMNLNSNLNVKNKGNLFVYVWIQFIICGYLVLINSMYFHPLMFHESSGTSFCLELIISNGCVVNSLSLPTPSPGQAHSPRLHTMQWTNPGEGSQAAYCVCVY